MYVQESIREQFMVIYGFYRTAVGTVGNCSLREDSQRQARRESLTGAVWTLIELCDRRTLGHLARSSPGVIAPDSKTIALIGLRQT